MTKYDLGRNHDINDKLPVDYEIFKKKQHEYINKLNLKQLKELKCLMKMIKSGICIMDKEDMVTFNASGFCFNSEGKIIVFNER